MYGSDYGQAGSDPTLLRPNMTSADPLRQMVTLTAAALGVPDVQLTVRGVAAIDLCSDRMVTTSQHWAMRSGYGNCDSTPEASDDAWTDVEEWVRSVAVVPLTGSSGEEGFLVAGSEKLDRFDDTTLEVLNRVAALAEVHLDRTAEQVRMDRLGEVLRSNQEELREAKDRLSISNEELEQFAYIAAHELVAPLRAVALYAEVLEPLVTADEVDHGQVSRVIESIQTGVADMDQQVKQLLQLSNVQGDLSEVSSLPLGDVVDKALSTLAVPLDEAGAVVEVRELPMVRARSVPLQSVFANLFSNALRYRHPARALRIEVSAQERHGNAIVSIADNGVGIDPESHDRIFQMFERGSTETAGSGIGLALSRRIVEAVGGNISLQSSSSDGAVFQVSLPLGAS